MRLNGSSEEAVQMIGTIRHKTCREAIPRRWRVKAGLGVTAPSVLWLFCWGKTGMGSGDAAADSREVFDRIFPIRFSDFDARVSHQYARDSRYTSGDIELELAAMLAQ
jgi:hypothetical protein